MNLRKIYYSKMVLYKLRGRENKKVSNEIVTKKQTNITTSEKRSHMSYSLRPAQK